MAAVHEDRNAQLSPGVAIKAPCRVGTTGNISLSGEQTVDGVALVSGDRVLVKNQTSGVGNGIYDVGTGAWTRSPDFDGNRDIATGTIVLLTAGTQANTIWQMTTAANPVVPGTTTMTFAALTSFSAAVSGGVLFGENGVPTQDGTHFFWDNANNRLGIGNATPTVPLDVSGTVRGTNFVPTGVGTNGLGLAGANNPALYVNGVNALNIINAGAGGWVGINTAAPTGVLEVGDSGLAAFKVVGLGGRTDGVEVAMVQNEGGLRTYGGYFMVVPTTSDLTWTKRVNNTDTEVLRITNAAGNVGLGNGNAATPTSFKFNVPRNTSVSFSEIGLFSQNVTLVGGIGVEGVTTNDLQVASIGDIHFYAGSTLVAGTTPTNEIFAVTSTVVKFGTNTAKGAEAFASFITIKDSGGTSRKLMVCA